MGDENKIRPDQKKMAKTAQKKQAGQLKKKSIKMDAKSHLEQAIKINPDFLDAYYELGCLLRDEGNLKGAEKQLSLIHI